MNHSRPPMRLFFRLAMIPVGILLFAMAPAFKDCMAKLRTPCAKLVEEDELAQLTGAKTTNVHVDERDDTCSGTYEDYFHRQLLFIDVQKDGSSEYGLSFAKYVKEMEAKAETVASEHIEGLGDEAVLAEIRGTTTVDVLLVNRSAQKGYVVFYLYPGSYPGVFSREDARKLIPLIKPRLALVDAFLVTRKSY